MLKLIKQRISFLGMLLCLLGSAYAAEVKVELLLWQVPETGEEMPVFYQSASKSSETVSLFKPGQLLQIITPQKDWKDWVEVALLDHSEKQTAWVLLEVIKLKTKLAITLNQLSNYCQVVIRDSDEAEKLSIYAGASLKGKKGLEEACLEFRQLEEELIKQRESMFEIMDRLSVAVMRQKTSEEELDKAGSANQKEKSPQTNTRRNRKLL